MVKDIPGGYIRGGDDHDYKNQIAEDLAGPINHFINPAKKFIQDLIHGDCLLFGFTAFQDTTNSITGNG
jgi:hypothetical protein